MVKRLSHIYLSHHRSDAVQAKELEKYLMQLKSEKSISIDYLGKFLGGKDIENEIYRNIHNARVIIILVSVDYLVECGEELAEIKNSDCFKNERVVPVPIGPCYLKGTGLEKLQPLPYDADFEEASYENRSILWNKVVVGLERILDDKKDVWQRDLLIPHVRANSNISDFDQDANPKTEKDAPLKLRLRSGEIPFRVDGDSMDPLHGAGDLLVGRPVTFDELKMNHRGVYIIVSRVQEPVLKFIKGFDSEKISLSSANPSHDDFEMFWQDIQSIFLVIPPKIC